MSMLRDYRMYTYEGGYTYQAQVRDSLGDSIGRLQDAHATFKVSVVARSRELADAWIEQRHNASYQDHTNFEYSLIDEQQAPHMLMEVPY